jgi:DNA invertase Pin-like site-specific DNA recombinase
MERARAAGRGIGRPQKVVDKNRLISMLAENQSKARIARSLGVSKATLYKELRQIAAK